MPTESQTVIDTQPHTSHTKSPVKAALHHAVHGSSDFYKKYHLSPVIHGGVVAVGLVVGVAVLDVAVVVAGLGGIIAVTAGGVGACAAAIVLSDVGDKVSKATKSYANDISPEQAQACERVGFRVAYLAPIFIAAAAAVSSTYSHYSNLPPDAPQTPVTTTIDGKSVSELPPIYKLDVK